MIVIMVFVSVVVVGMSIFVIMIGILVVMVIVMMIIFTLDAVNLRKEMSAMSTMAVLSVICWVQVKCVRTVPARKVFVFWMMSSVLSMVLHHIPKPIFNQKLFRWESVGIR